MFDLVVKAVSWMMRYWRGLKAWRGKALTRRISEWREKGC
jgi:hypothetical protein